MANKLKNIALSAALSLPLFFSGCDPILVNSNEGVNKTSFYQLTNTSIPITSTNSDMPYSLSFSNSINYTSVPINILTTNTYYLDSKRQEDFQRAFQHQKEIKDINEMNKRKQLYKNNQL